MPPGVTPGVTPTRICQTFFAPTFEHTKTVDFFLIFTVNTCPTVLHEAPGRFAEAMVEGTNVRRRTATTARLVSFSMGFKVITQGHVAGGYAFCNGSPWAMPKSADRYCEVNASVGKSRSPATTAVTIRAATTSG
ncbi:MAG: hypothetical protein ACO33D_07900, partial [Ilumatobacteraceae bacterium]